MHAVLSTLLVLLAAASAGVTDPLAPEASDGPVLPDDDPTAIVNGTNSSLEQVVALVFTDPWLGDSSFCSGSQIHPQWVLTAAHCLDDLSLYTGGFGFDLAVTYGSNIWGQSTDSIRFDTFFMHPDYNPQNFANDVGLIRLNRPKNGIELAVLNDDAVHDGWNGRDLVVAGYGVTGDSADDAGVKRETELGIFDYDEYVIYVSNAGTNICSGDSGGPAFEMRNGQLEQVSVNSFGRPSCENWYAGLARIDDHIDWIQSYVPDIILDGDDDLPPPEPGETEPTETIDPIEVDDDVLDRFDDEGDDPARPKAYPFGVRGCATAPMTWGWLGVLPVLALTRRSRRSR